MQKAGFSREEINGVVEIIRKDIIFGRKTFLKELLPELIDLAKLTVFTSQLEEMSRKISEGYTKKERPASLGKEGVLLNYVMTASIILHQNIERYHTSGRMEEIANNLFLDMVKSLRNLQKFKYDMANEFRRYHETIKYTREGNVALPIKKKLLDPFEYADYTPPSLAYIRVINYWKFLPLGYTSSIKDLFEYSEMGMINDVPIPTKPLATSYITAWEVTSAMWRIGEHYLLTIPKKTEELTGTISGALSYGKEAEKEYKEGKIELEISSGPTYGKITYSDIYSDTEKLALSMYNYRLQYKDKFDSLINKLSYGTAEEIEKVLNISFLKDEVPNGSAILVSRRRADGLESWIYIKTADGKFGYIGKLQTKENEIVDFFGAEAGKVIAEGAGSTYLVVSPIPFTKEYLKAGASWDNETKNAVVNLLIDPKIRKLLFVDNPLFLLEAWPLISEEKVIYYGGKVISGEGKNCVKLHFLTGDRKKIEITYWDEKGFLSLTWIRKLKEYQSTLETKFNFPPDFLSYIALATTEYVEKESKTEWVTVLERNGIKFQLSYTPVVHYLTKFTIDTEKGIFTIEGGTPYGQVMINFIGSTQIDGDRVSGGLFATNKIMVGGKVIYNRSDEMCGFITDVLLSAAGWTKEGFKHLPINEEEVDKLDDEIGYTILTGLGIKKVAYVAFEYGEIAKQFRRGVGADVYLDSGTLNLLKGKGSTKLFVIVEENSGKVFVTHRELDKETLAKLGLSYYEINKKGEIFRVDIIGTHYWEGLIGEEQKSHDYKVNVRVTRTWPSAWFGLGASWVPGKEEYDIWASGGIKLPRETSDKIAVAAISAVIITFLHDFLRSYSQREGEEK